MVRIFETGIDVTDVSHFHVTADQKSVRYERKRVFVVRNVAVAACGNKFAVIVRSARNNAVFGENILRKRLRPSPGI